MRPSTSFFAALLFLALPLVSCGGGDSVDKGSGGTPSADEAPKAQTVAVESAEREVRCGCTIDGINQCGNYVHVDDQWLEISNPADHELGNMEWCKAARSEVTVKAVVAGERTDDKIAVSQLEVQ